MRAEGTIDVYEIALSEPYAAELADDLEDEEGQEREPLLLQLGNDWERNALQVIAERPQSQEARDLQRQADYLGASAIQTLEYWRSRAVPDLTFVYFAAASTRRGYAQGPVKIGFALDPVKRLAELQCGNPFDVLAYEIVLATPALERQLHRHYWHLRARGEWFSCPNGAHVLLDRAHNAAVAQVREYEQRGCKMSYLRSDLVQPILMPGGYW